MERHTQGLMQWEEIVVAVSTGGDEFVLRTSWAAAKSLRGKFNNWKAVLRRAVIAAELRQVKGKPALPTDLRAIELAEHADRTMCKLEQVAGVADLWEIKWQNKDKAGSELLKGLVCIPGAGAPLPKHEEDVIQAAARRIMEAQQGQQGPKADILELDQAAIDRAKKYGARNPGAEPDPETIRFMTGLQGGPSGPSGPDKKENKDGS